VRVWIAIVTLWHDKSCRSLRSAMSRPSFAIFAQQYLDAILKGFGEVYLNEPMPRDPKLRVYKHPSRSNPGTDILKAVVGDNPRIMISPEIVAEAKLVDVLFEPNQALSRETLGLLGQLLFVPSIIAPFRWSPDSWTIRKSQSALFLWDAADHGCIIPVDEEPVYEDDDDDYDYDEEAEEEEEEITKNMVMIVPSIDRKLIKGFGLSRSSRKISGVYEFAPAFWTTVVVTNELPKTPATLWLRILGRGPTQRGAIEELIKLEESPLRNIAMQQLRDWYHSLLDGNMGHESKALMNCLAKLPDH
jgi:hypothetical protein